MLRLLQFLYLRRVLFVFIFLELSCIFLIKNNSPYYSAYFFTSSNELSSKILKYRTNTISYFSLVKQNNKLQSENAQLKQKALNSLSSYKYKKLSFKNQYIIREARVINNSIHYGKNYITLDIGSIDGVKVGMGVIGEDGIIGMVKSTSTNFSTITSVLHHKFRTSVKVGKERTLSSLGWNGDDYRYCELLHLPKHVKINVGDTVYSSGYGGIFPEEIIIGFISEIKTEEDKSFHKVKIDLINNFRQLNFAYVVIDKNKDEKENIENNSKNEQ